MTTVDSSGIAASRPSRYAAPGTATHTSLLCGAYQLDQRDPHPLFQELAEITYLPAGLERHRPLRTVVELLAEELELPRPGAEAALPALLDVLLLQALRAWLDQRPGPPATGWSAAVRDPATARALRCIHSDPSQQWRVDDLANAAGLSRAAFCRRFTAMVGESPGAYLTRWRLTTAARLLRDSDASLAKIAKRTGYRSEFAFAKAFKREYHLSPGGYRRRSWDATGLSAR